MCNCQVTNCNCNGFPQEFPEIPEIPYITNITVNPNNTLTVILSNGNTITTSNSITIPSNQKAYIFNYITTPSNSFTLSIPPNTLTNNGDLMNIKIEGILDISNGANPLITNINGNTKTLIADPNFINTGGYISLDIQLIRFSSTTIKAYYKYQIRSDNPENQTAYSYFEAQVNLIYPTFNPSGTTVFYIGQQSNGTVIPSFNFLHSFIIKNL